MQEPEAYSSLYQEGIGRMSKDGAITILQGRAVGGTTLVNWTSSFRTPDATLEHWAKEHGVKGHSPAEMAPWFAKMEERLGVAPWIMPPNFNNDVIRRGCEKLGYHWKVIPRNVRGCWNLGYCGMGCPTNAKQSMLVTTLPSALDKGATLLVETHAEAFDLEGGLIAALRCAPVAANGTRLSSGAATRIVARHYVVAGGAINSPALLLRSRLPDPHGLLGKRTFLHPVVISAALFDQAVHGWDGAPQTIYSDHFLETQAIDGPIGYKLEAPPVHPVIFASTLPGYGREQTELLTQFPNTHALLALLRDGFHPLSPGGEVRLRSDGSPVLDYPLNEFVMEGARRALLSMAEIQFAAGARSVLPVHELARRYTSWSEARAAIAALPMKPLLTRVVSAHVMGGCGMGGDERRGVVRADGVHWQVPNLSVHDGSLFPTSIGANPQLSVYGFVNRLATGLAKRLSGRDVRLA
jgi:choline dehydrogenase-like flavoprotein